MTKHAPLARGVSLVELLIVIVLLGIASASVIGLNGNLFSYSSDIKTIQTNAQLLEACVDRVIGIRKSAGYAALQSTSFSTNCAGISVPTGTTMSVTSITPLSQTCPMAPTSNCTQLEIKVTGYNVPVTLYFVNY
jgi:prepilin-type N-terminal cleavage/methylation domain-containing protein